MDSHNLKRFGLNAKDFKFSKKNKSKRVERYLQACKDAGGSEYLWDSWCSYIAGNNYNIRLSTAEEVSAEHVRCIA